MVATTRRPAAPPAPSSTSPGRRARAAAAVLGTILGTGAIVALAAPAQAASVIPGCSHPSEAATVTCTFGYTGSTQTFDIPAGVTSIAVSAAGGQGGSAFGIPGGRGALVSGTFSVHGGDKIDITVGGDGTGWDGAPARGAGGFGFGSGGSSDFTADPSSGGGGGGATGVADGPTVLLVAGAGGGSGSTDLVCGKGGAGGDAGQDGQPGTGTGCIDAGGVGGAAGAEPSHDGGQGVTAGNTTRPQGSGGGGGGYLGGAGGVTGVLSFSNGRQVCCTSNGGGGGGTSYADPSGGAVDLSGLSARSAGSNGQVTISFAAADTTAPVAHPSTDAPVNPAGWINDSPVRVNWGWSDSGGQIDPSSCTDQSTVSAEGSTTLTPSCADVWGNLGTTSYTVNIDTSKPVDAPSQTQTAAGTTVDWNWSDATSGVDTTQCQQHSTTTSTFGAVLTASCTDIAGNTATGTYTVQDKTAPTDNPVVTPAANAAGWHNTDVTVAWNWTDNGSGVNPDPVFCLQTQPVHGEGFGSPAAGACQDLARNQGSDLLSINIDKTKPVDAPVVSTTASGASVAWNWSDALSGVDPTKCTQSSSQSGTGQLTLTSSCTDVAGNTATDSKTVTVSAPASKADVQVTLTGPASGSKGTAYTYTVTTKDAGPGAAANVVSTLLLPDGATLVSASGSPVRLGPLLTWTAPNLASGGSVSYSVTVKFPAPARGAKSQTWALGAAAASLPTRTTSATPDPNLLNNLAAVLTKIS